MGEITWQKEAKETFDKVINELPQFHRSIAEKLVKESSEALAEKKGLGEVSQEVLIETFFKEVPPAFRDMMKRLFTQLNIDYAKYIKS
ncbi:MAG: DUF2621 family protein [Candidatus Omnitrophota bacterium]